MIGKVDVDSVRFQTTSKEYLLRLATKCRERQNYHAGRGDMDWRFWSNMAKKFDHWANLKGNK